MEQYIQASCLTEWKMGMGSKCGKMDLNMTDNGNVIKPMDKEL